MDGGSHIALSPFRAKLERWRFVGGGVDSNGNIVREPWPLIRAKIIDNLCQRYSCLPSQLLAEDAGLIFQIYSILALSGEYDNQTTSPMSNVNAMEQGLANMSGLS